MNVRIHRGAHEIGGSCVEIEADGARIVLDVGLPLDGGPDSRLPNVPGLASGDDASLLGVVLSHGHGDHAGLLERVHADVPHYCGEVTAAIAREAAFFGVGANLNPSGYLCHGESLGLGPFTITPHLVDHSAFDAYALVIEAGGQQLLYSGDVRTTGRKPGMLARMAGELRAKIDTLILEGTAIRSRPAPKATVATETDAENGLIEVMRSCHGAVLVAYSPQNVDRLVSIFRASKRSGRRLVMDLYAARVAAATGRSSIPRPSWDDAAFYLPGAQRARVIRAGAFKMLDELKPYRLYPEDLAAQRSKLTIGFRASMVPELASAGALEDAQAVWSLWPGYIQREPGAQLPIELERLGVPLQTIHASGHASVSDLQDFATQVEARRVVPIHTDAPERFPELFDNVDIRQDGEWWSTG